MSSATGVNPDKALEVVQKTYDIQTTNNHHHPPEHRSPVRQSATVKLSNHQPSRKTSVHDVQEATREDLNKVRLISSRFCI